MTAASRLALAASTVLATALLVVGCASSPGSPTPTSSPAPDSSDDTSTSDDGGDIEAAWLDNGRMFAIVTWGSSTCVPVVDGVSAEGQTVTVSLTVAPEGGTETEKACTSDLAPRASTGALPEGVDPTQDVEFVVTIGDSTEDVDLDGNPTLTGTAGDSTDFTPSAGWFDDDGVVLLTWGSSTCPPVIENVEVQDGGATVTIAADEGMCTMDMAPRATVLGFGDDSDVDSDADFTLTLVGGNLDATVPVLQG